MLDLNKCKLVPGITANWGEITGNIETQKDLVEYVSSHGGGNAEWGSISGTLSDQTDLMNKFSSYATQSWVSDQNYLTATALSGYATESWVTSQGYLVEDDLSQYATRQWVTGRSYATESWVESQSYLTSTALSGYATESWVQSQGYLTEHQDLSSYATQSWVSDQNYLTATSLSGYATESWVQSQGYYIQASGETVLCTVQPTEMDPIVSTGLIVGTYIPSDFVEGVYLNNAGAGRIYYNYQNWEETRDPFITESGLPDYLSGYATESWVQSQGYALNTDLLSLASRVSAIESTLGVAMSITNEILS